MQSPPRFVLEGWSEGIKVYSGIRYLSPSVGDHHHNQDMFLINKQYQIYEV